MGGFGSQFIIFKQIEMSCNKVSNLPASEFPSMNELELRNNPISEKSDPPVRPRQCVELEQEFPPVSSTPYKGIDHQNQAVEELPPQPQENTVKLSFWEHWSREKRIVMLIVTIFSALCLVTGIIVLGLLLSQGNATATVISEDRYKLSSGQLFTADVLQIQQRNIIQPDISQMVIASYVNPAATGRLLQQTEPNLLILDIVDDYNTGVRFSSPTKFEVDVAVDDLLQQYEAQDPQSARRMLQQLQSNKVDHLRIEEDDLDELAMSLIIRRLQAMNASDDGFIFDNPQTVLQDTNDAILPEVAAGLQLAPTDLTAQYNQGITLQLVDPVQQIFEVQTEDIQTSSRLLQGIFKYARNLRMLRRAMRGPAQIVKKAIQNAKNTVNSGISAVVLKTNGQFTGDAEYIVSSQPRLLQTDSTTDTTANTTTNKTTSNTTTTNNTVPIKKSGRNKYISDQARARLNCRRRRASDGTILCDKNDVLNGRFRTRNGTTAATASGIRRRWKLTPRNRYRRKNSAPTPAPNNTANATIAK